MLKFEKKKINENAHFKWNIFNFQLTGKFLTILFSRNILKVSKSQIKILKHKKKDIFDVYFFTFIFLKQNIFRSVSYL